MKNFVIFSALLLASQIDVASARDASAVQLSLTAGNIAQQRLDINQKLTQVDYVEMTPDKRKVLDQSLDALEGGQLTSADALEAQNKVNEILKQAFADSKMVCTFEQPVGTNMKKKSCTTAGAKRRAYEKTQLDGVNVKQ